MCVIDSDQPIIMILITIHEESSCWIHNCTAIYLLITNIKSISSLCSRKCCPSSKERVQAGGGHWVRLDFVSQFVRRPPRCPPGLPPIWLKLSNRVVAAGWDNAKRWWSGQLPVLTLSAPAIRGCALQFSFLLLFFEKLCSWQLPWWPQPLDGSSHKGQLWPEISAGSLHYKLSTPIIFTFHHPQIFCRAQQYFRWTNLLFVCLIFGDWIQKNTKCHQNNIFSLPILNMCVCLWSGARGWG